MTTDIMTREYLDAIRELLAEDQRHSDAVETARRAGQAQLTDALAAHRRVNDNLSALTDRIRRLDGQVNSAVLRAGSPEVTDDIRTAMPPAPLNSVEDITRAVEAVEKDLLTLRSALEWLDRNPPTARPGGTQTSPGATTAGSADPAPAVPAPVQRASAAPDPSGSARKWVALAAVLIALVILGYLFL